MRKWIRLSGAGEFRGEGRWFLVVGAEMEKDFDYCKRTGHFPVAWSVEGKDKVKAGARTPNLVIEDGVLIHQFHDIAVPVIGNGDAATRYAAKQLQSIVDHLTIEGAR
ncbi:hypothetical protein Pan1_84 [Pseudanabaena phage Pan1]|nr:hypothetical protein Pan1_84 [Pseudanabaena phage Pan1]